MKGITLTQPWAALVAIGAKTIETRRWQTSYRGPLAIHAAKGWTAGDRELVENPYGVPLCAPFVAALRPAGYTQASELPRGAIVAVVRLFGCAFTSNLFPGWRRDYYGGKFWELTDQERAFGDYSPGRYAWLLADVQRLPEPVPCKGALGLWDLPAEVEAQIRGQL
jgi:hypothetical protein